MLIPKSFTVDDKLYEEFRKLADIKAVSFSKWLRNCMERQIKIWKDNKNVKR